MLVGLQQGDAAFCAATKELAGCDFLGKADSPSFGSSFRESHQLITVSNTCSTRHDIKLDKALPA